MKNIVFGLSWFLCLYLPFLLNANAVCSVTWGWASTLSTDEKTFFISILVLWFLSLPSFFFFEFPLPCLHFPPFLVWREVKVAQSCPTLCDPKDYTVHGILQAGILELGSLSFLQGIFLTQGLNPGLPHCRRMLYQLSHQGSPPTFFVSALYLLCTQSLSRVWLFATPWTAARQAPLCMGFSRQEYWSGLPCPPPGNLPNPGIESRSLALHVDSLLSEPLGKLKNTVWVAFQLKYELEFEYGSDDFFFFLYRLFFLVFCHT